MDLLPLNCTVMLQSDFHVGTGYGVKGIADSRQMTDPQGRPMIPKRQLRGLLRDRLEYLVSLYGDTVPSLKPCDGRYESGPGGTASTLCGVNHPTWTVEMPCPVCRIFGSPVTPRGFEFGDARAGGADLHRLPPQRTAARAGREMVAKAHVTIDPSTGRAKGDHLYGIEVARPEGALCLSIVEAPEHMVYDDAVRKLDAVLLVAAVRMLRRVGGKRRRGLGRCVLEPQGGPLEGQTWQALLATDLRGVLTGG